MYMYLFIWRVALYYMYSTVRRPLSQTNPFMILYNNDWLTASKACRSNPYVLIYLCFRIKVLISRSGFSEVVSRVFTVWHYKKSFRIFFSNTKALPEGTDISNACVFVWLLFVRLRYVIEIIGPAVFTAYCIRAIALAGVCMWAQCRPVGGIFTSVPAGEKFSINHSAFWLVWVTSATYDLTSIMVQAIAYKQN